MVTPKNLQEFIEARVNREHLSFLSSTHAYHEVAKEIAQEILRVAEECKRHPEASIPAYFKAVQDVVNKLKSYIESVDRKEVTKEEFLKDG